MYTSINQLYNYMNDLFFGVNLSKALGERKRKGNHSEAVALSSRELGCFRLRLLLRLKVRHGVLNRRNCSVRI